ncbi:MAG: hypothetical protein K2Y32_19055 [Candidatus Obscuribacterales bacterium]|nr:hypothetical protein [Candidatus Obscuribacterales bacterium]
MQKVSNSIRCCYNDQVERNTRLKSTVDGLIRPSAFDKGWHYTSRLKEIGSFAQKLETGRVKDPAKLDDFFACTIVVKNATEITDVLELVLSHCTEKYRQPKKAEVTFNSPEEFKFDDLRLYVTLTQSFGLPDLESYNTVFEVQIKTFLQYAWGIATHDLVYKTDNISWSKARIAYQIKAVLEHAEVSITQAESLSKSPELAKRDARTTQLIEIVDFLKSSWEPGSLPSDLKRLAETIQQLLLATNINLSELKTALDLETTANRGTKVLNLSPYGIIIQSLLLQQSSKMDAYLKNPNAKFKILIPAEVDVPATIDLTTAVNARLVGQRL